MTLEKVDPVEVFDAGDKGRGLRTTKALVIGDVVFTEASFSAVVFDRWVPVRFLWAERLHRMV